MNHLPSQEGFLGLSAEMMCQDHDSLNKAMVIPFGLEASVTFGQGTSMGPQAILEASREVETFDQELWCEPCRKFSLETLAPQSIPNKVEEALAQLDNLVEAAKNGGYFPLVLGGEHSITPGAIRPFVREDPNLVVVHFDAHADLRDGYLGQRFSHASAMRRCLDFPGVSIVSLGIRNISQEEADDLPSLSSRVHIFWAHEKRHWLLDEIMALCAGRRVYLSFDLDALDSSAMPATGTPEPGGLFWDDCLPIIARVMKECDVLGADIVELAPIPGFHACNFLAAKLAYKILSYRFC